MCILIENSRLLWAKSRCKWIAIKKNVETSDKDKTFKMQSQANKDITELRSISHVMAYPELDGAPLFHSSPFESFVAQKGNKHTFILPYHPPCGKKTLRSICSVQF